MSAFVKTFLARFISAGGSFAIVVALAHQFGAEALGVFAVVHAFFVAGSLLATLGAGEALMKFVGADPSGVTAARVVRYAATRTLIVGSIFGVVLASSAYYLSVIFEMHELRIILPGVAFSLPFMGLVRVFSGAYKGVGRSGIGCLMDNGGVLLLMAILIIVGSFYKGNEFAAILTFSYVTAVILFFAVGAFGLRQFWKRPLRNSINLAPDRIASELKYFRLVSRDFLFVNASSLLLHSGVFFIAALYLSKQDVGLLKAAQQLAVVIEFVQIVLNSIYPPLFARAWAQKQIEELSLLAQRCFTFGFWGAFPFYLLILFFSSELLMLVDDEFSEAGLILILVATGQMIKVLAGASVQLLGMTSYSRTLRNISVTSYLVSFILTLLLLERFSVVGGAIGLLFFMVLPNILALISVTSLLKIKVIPKPSEFVHLTHYTMLVILRRAQ